MRILDLDRETWQIYSMTKADILTQGKKRGDLDILNASLAKRYGLIVVTNNTSHYDDLVQVENWIQS
jgi:predicted nucleic acid-binding protein